MMLKWALIVLLLYHNMLPTSSSIAGVTYMDDFDFEQRYRDVDECNPFKWHPLHLPEMCADLFEQMIRARIGKHAGGRLMVEKEEDYEKDQQIPEYMQHSGYNYYSPEYIINSPQYNSPDDHTYEIYPEHEAKSYRKGMPKLEYIKLLEQLIKDIRKNPSHAEIGVLPNVGPAAIYKQEISQKSEHMIKRLSTNYAKFFQNIYADYPGYNYKSQPQIFVYDSHKNTTKLQKKKHRHDKKKSRLSRTRTENNGLVTIIETLHPNEDSRRRRKRSTLYILGL